jgi:GntR family transcriptional regulator/MocR family aminotransferase
MERSTGISLSKTSSEPLYKQLFDQIVARILSRAFPAGYRLPPTRQLAAELRTNRNTVVRAYADLEDAGFVASTVGRGTFVALVPPNAVASKAPSDGGMPWASLVASSAKLDTLRRAQRFNRNAGRDVINLTQMQPSADLLPDRLVRRCIDHVMQTQGSRALGYAPHDGLPALRQLIVDDLARQGVPAHADDVLITTGSQQGIDLVARALLAPGDTFLVDAATYAGAINVFSLAGGRLVPVPSDTEGPDMAALERLTRAGAKGLYLMPNCNNPTGAEISAARRKSLVSWSQRAGVPLIEDDYGSDLWLGESAPPPALRSLSGDVIYMGTFSKKLVPALRIGFIVCPQALRPVLVGIKRTVELGTSLLLQHVLAEFLDRGYLRAHLNKTLPEYRRRRDALEQSLFRHLPSGMKWRRPERGLVLWLPLPRGFDSENVFDEALRRGVLVGPSALYEVEPRPERGLRLTFCAEPAERLALGARRLGEALRAMAKQQRRPHEAVELQAV